jgi:hypothetical protein
VVPAKRRLSATFLRADLEKVGISPRALLALPSRYEVSLQALLSQAVGVFRRRNVVALIWFQGERGRPVIS